MKRILEIFALAVAVSSMAMLLAPKSSAQSNQSPAQTRPRPLRPVHTYSIVARNAETGELGVAVQSHWFSVGPIVPWAEAGVGAVATQSFVDPSYGKLGLDLMRVGRSAPDALKALLAGDEGRDVRQVAMIDAQGRVDAWTGSKDIQAAGHTVGKNYSVQANLMLNDKVWPAMSRAFETAKGDLAERMLAALDAAQAAGGDIRGPWMCESVRIMRSSSAKYSFVCPVSVPSRIPCSVAASILFVASDWSEISVLMIVFRPSGILDAMKSVSRFLIDTGSSRIFFWEQMGQRVFQSWTQRRRGSDIA